MTMTEAIRSRRSVRTFSGEPLRVEDKQTIMAFAEAAEEAGLEPSFILDDPGLATPANTVYIATYQLK